MNKKERFAMNTRRELDDYKTSNKILINTATNGFVEYNQRKLIKSTKCHISLIILKYICAFCRKVCKNLNAK